MPSGGNRLNSGRKIGYVFCLKGKKFEGITEAAKHFKVNKSTIHRWCKSDKIVDCWMEPKENIPDVKMEDIQLGAKDNKMSPLEFMLKVMNDEAVDIKVRVQMANWAAPYVHPKATKGTGKRDELERKAKEAGQGRFAPGKAPLRAVK
jgi:hypothetical protein